MEELMIHCEKYPGGTRSYHLFRGDEEVAKIVDTESYLFGIITIEDGKCILSLPDPLSVNFTMIEPDNVYVVPVTYSKPLPVSGNPLLDIIDLAAKRQNEFISINQ